MKILFISDNFPPEVNAPATRTVEHCREWVKNGDQVTVITCFPNFPQGKVYDGYKNRLFQKENIDGIDVIRVWSYISANQGFFRRTMDYISFGLMAFFASFFVKADIVVATSPQFFAALSGRFVGFFKRRPWVMEVRDLWPESIKTVGAVKQSAVIYLFEKLELYLYAKASKIIVVTDSFKKNLESRGVDSDKVKVVKNGANLDLYVNRKKDANLETDLKLKDKYVVGYIGTHGLAHSLPFIIDSICEVKDEEIHFLFVGSGAVKADIVAKAELLNLKNITFLDPIPKEEVPRYLSLLSLMLVPLKKSDTFKKVIPSKIFETCAMQVPILLGVEGEANDLVTEYGVGHTFEPENKDSFLKELHVIKTLSKDECNVMKRNCLSLAEDFDRKKLALSMRQELINLVE